MFVVIVITFLLIMYRYCREKIDVYLRFELRMLRLKATESVFINVYYAALNVFIIKKGFFVYRVNTGHAGRRSEETTSGN